MIGEAYFRENRRELMPGFVGEAPNVPAVFLVHAREGRPYLAKTALLRRRLARLFRERDRPSRLLNLSGVAERIEYWLCGSRLESSLLFYSLARRHFPDDYLKIAKLRFPAYMKLILSNPFPRTQVTQRLGGGRGLYLGPFRTRASAEQFESQALDLFQLRRCQENLEPRADHPGCIYGEMSMCLRPCQEVVGEAEYASETERFSQFLTTGGASLLESIGAARDRCSEELQFEEAARQHKRYERVEQVLALRDDLVGAVLKLCGVAVTRSAREGCVALWFVREGCWADPVELDVGNAGAGPVPLDHRLREAVAGLGAARVSNAERQEHMALLASWFYSSWRDGEWLGFESVEKAPYRKLVNAVARVAKGALPPPAPVE
jgi:excinuclease UvrABC nuclease subunit